MVASAGTTQEKPVTPGDPVQTEQQNKVLSSPGQLEKEDKTLGDHVHIKKEDKPLGEHQYLEKQDQLRDIGIATGTSRIVVVGSQSSGKSSLLENLTGLSFPRGPGLCTRFVTQITLHRGDSFGATITIMPSSSSSSDRKSYLKRFRYTVDGDWQISDLPNIISEASTYKEIILKVGREDLRTNLIESYNNRKRQLGSEKAFDAAVEAAFGSRGLVDELHAILQAYYKIAIDRFLDSICRQAVSYFLLEADNSPVKVLKAEFIVNLSDSQLERIAGEDAMTRAKRLALEAEREPLEKALKVLRE